MLEVKDAKISFGERTLFEHLSFTADDGEMVCIVGESGVGKSSLLSAMLGMQPLAAGHISIDGELLTPASAEAFRRFIAYVPQNLSIPAETVKELVAWVFEIKVNANKRWAKAQLLDEWSKLRLEPKLYDCKASELSGGERQRVMISICGLLKKPIVIVDEPTSALDPVSAEAVTQYLKNIANGGATVIMASHNMQLAQQCDKIVTLTHNS